MTAYAAPRQNLLGLPVPFGTFYCEFMHDRFYRAMLRRARYCYGKLSVRPSVCPSVRNVEVL